MIKSQLFKSFGRAYTIWRFSWLGLVHWRASLLLINHNYNNPFVANYHAHFIVVNNWKHICEIWCSFNIGIFSRHTLTNYIRFCFKYFKTPRGPWTLLDHFLPSKLWLWSDLKSINVPWVVGGSHISNPLTHSASTLGLGNREKGGCDVSGRHLGSRDRRKCRSSEPLEAHLRIFRLGTWLVIVCPW